MKKKNCRNFQELRKKIVEKFLNSGKISEKSLSLKKLREEENNETRGEKLSAVLLILLLHHCLGFSSAKMWSP